VGRKRTGSVRHQQNAKTDCGNGKRAAQNGRNVGATTGTDQRYVQARTRRGAVTANGNGKIAIITQKGSSTKRNAGGGNELQQCEDRNDMRKRGNAQTQHKRRTSKTWGTQHAQQTRNR